LIVFLKILENNLNKLRIKIKDSNDNSKDSNKTKEQLIKKS